MPNYCFYQMKIKGSKESIERVKNCLKANYDYSTGEVNEEHFFRVFSCYDDYEYNDYGDGTFSTYVDGDCAWSIACAMIDQGKFSYYNDLKTKYPELFKGTTLFEQSRDCTIEVFGEAEGDFAEHYVFENGECIVEESDNTETKGFDENGNVVEIEDWDTYDGDYITDNPFREEIDGAYKWTI